MSAEEESSVEGRVIEAAWEAVAGTGRSDRGRRRKNKGHRSESNPTLDGALAVAFVALGLRPGLLFDGHFYRTR